MINDEYWSDIDLSWLLNAIYTIEKWVSLVVFAVRALIAADSLDSFVIIWNAYGDSPIQSHNQHNTNLNGTLLLMLHSFAQGSHCHSSYKYTRHQNGDGSKKKHAHHKPILHPKYTHNHLESICTPIIQGHAFSFPPPTLKTSNPHRKIFASSLKINNKKHRSSINQSMTSVNFESRAGLWLFLAVNCGCGGAKSSPK